MIIKILSRHHTVQFPFLIFQTISEHIIQDILPQRIRKEPEDAQFVDAGYDQHDQ